MSKTVPQEGTSGSYLRFHMESLLKHHLLFNQNILSASHFSSLADFRDDTRDSFGSRDSAHLGEPAGPPESRVTLATFVGVLGRLWGRWGLWGQYMPLALVSLR